MYYSENAPFYRPIHEGYNVEGSRVYMYRMREGEYGWLRFACKYDKQERKRLSTLCSSRRRKGLYLEKIHMDRLFDNGMIYDYKTYEKLLDIYCMRSPEARDDEYRARKDSVRMKIYYRKKNKKKFEKELIEEARHYNLKIPVV